MRQRPATSARLHLAGPLALRRARRRLPEADADLMTASPHDLALAGDVDRFFSRTQSVPPVTFRPAPLPPGSPIGGLAGCGGP